MAAFREELHGLLHGLATKPDLHLLLLRGLVELADERRELGLSPIVGAEPMVGPEEELAALAAPDAVTYVSVRSLPLLLTLTLARPPRRSN